MRRNIGPSLLYGTRWQLLLSCAFLLLMIYQSRASLGNTVPVSRLSNEELLSRADRAFLMRNFLASEKYYRELNERLANQLSHLAPNEQQEQIEIAEELILGPFGLGHSLIYLHRYSEARDVLEKGLKIYPDWANSHVPLTFFQDPLFTGPVLNDLKEQMLAKDNHVPSLMHGYIQFFGGNLQEAEQSFSRVLSQDPGNFMAKYFSDHIRSASKRRSSNDTDQLNVDPENLPVDQLIDYGSSFFKNANYSMAARLFKKAIDLDHQIPVVHIAYGDSLFALGRFDEATQAILKGLEIYPKYAEGAINRRDFYNNPSEFDLQLRKLENFVTAHPSNQNARFLLGYNYFFTQDYAKAEEQLKAVLSNKTLYSSAQFLQGLIQKFNSHRPRKDL